MLDKKEDELKVVVSVILPCLNEEASVGICIEKCFQIFSEQGIAGEVVVVDNGSSDRSKEIILKSQARLIEESRRGYGSAYLKGFAAAKGYFLIMADADDTYDFFEISKFLEKLKEGNDFVIGNRLNGDIAQGKGAMPWLHRYIGSPFLTWLLNFLFKIEVKDAHCGMRAFTREAYQKLFLQTTGMEFASEMIINAGKAQLKIAELPINYRLRMGESKLRTFKDGWRHLRFMLLYSPTFLFLFPGAVLFFLGTIIIAPLTIGPVVIFGFFFDYNYMFLGSMMMLIGYQIINLAFFTKMYAYSEKFEDEKNDKIVKFLSKYIKLETMILIGLIIFLIGFSLLGYVYYLWMRRNNLGVATFFEVRKMIIAVTLMVLGLQTIFFGFFYSILRIKKV